MGIEWFRDLVLCIFGLGATLSVIFIAVMVLLVYRKIRPILDSIKSTVKTVENISSCVEQEVVKPLARVSAFIQGINQAISLVSQFSKREKGDGK